MDNVAVLTEGEARYWIDPRWMVIAFGGVGRVAPAWDELGSASNVPAGGVGFRYLIARRLGLQAGMDVGFGPSSSRAVYLQVGSAGAESRFSPRLKKSSSGDGGPTFSPASPYNWQADRSPPWPPG